MNLCGRGDKDVFTVAQLMGSGCERAHRARVRGTARGRARRSGDLPDRGRSGFRDLARAAEGLPAAGADLIEIGMPFTDPMADGPAIQAAGLRALAGGPRSSTLELVRRFRAVDPATPIVLMGYYNPIYAYGDARFLTDAKAAGVDGLIVVDLPPEEDDELCLPARAAGLDFIRLATPTTDDRRLPAVLRIPRASSIMSRSPASPARRRPWPTGSPRRSRASSGTRAAGRRRFRHPRAGAGGRDRAHRRCRRGRHRPGRSGRTQSRRRRPGDAGTGARRARQGPGPGRAVRGAPDELAHRLCPAEDPRALHPREDGPAGNLWHQCPSCERMIFHRDLESNQRVCPHCDHHMRVGPDYRFEALFDEGSWQRIEMPRSPADPLRFRDQKRYADRLKEAQAKTKAVDALEAASGRIDGLPAVIAVMNFEFMGGSMGTSLGEGFVVAARQAVKQDAAFVVVTSSGGARMQEGALSLMQMARTTVVIEEVKEAGLPYIVILTDPTTGGVTASFAMIGDIHLAEPGA